MEYITFDSDDIDRVGYNGNTLYVLFYNGGWYAYQNVDREIFLGFQYAESPRAYFNAHVRNRYKGTKTTI